MGSLSAARPGENQMPNQPVYVDHQNRILILSQGIGNTEWGTFHRKPSGSLARVKSLALPMRFTREEAERDLHEQARRKKWRRVE
jgi:hypothetical protein